MLFGSIFIFGLLGGGAWGAEFSYNNKGSWGTLFPDFCSGSSQSPIELPAEKVNDPDVKPLLFRNYRKRYDAWLVNDQHALKVNVDPGHDNIEISGSVFPSKERYRFHSFHIHWGSTDTQGAEHTVAGKPGYPAEIHLIHYNTKYADLAEAVQHPDGLTVLGLFVQVGHYDNPFFESIISRLDEINGQPSSTESSIFKLRLSSLFPPNPSDFWQYPGSLTTPTCNEVVNWHVFRKPVLLSENQLNDIRSLVDSSGISMSDNYRDPQPLNQRQVRQHIEKPLVKEEAVDMFQRTLAAPTYQAAAPAYPSAAPSYPSAAPSYHVPPGYMLMRQAAPGSMLIHPAAQYRLGPVHNNITITMY